MQNFSSSSSVSAYFGIPVNNDKVDSIGTTGTGTTVSIGMLSGTNTLRFVRSSDTGLVLRNTDFSPVPNTLVFQFDLGVSGTFAVQTNAATWEVGESLVVNPVVPLSPATHSYIALDLVNDATSSFRLRTLSGLSTQVFNGSGHVTWVINHSGAPINYRAPNQMNSVVGVDKADLWVDNTLVFDEIDALQSLNALKNFKFVYQSGTAVLDMTNFLIDPIPAQPVLLPPTSISETGFTIQWSPVSDVTGYRLDVATDGGFANILSQYSNLEIPGQSSSSFILTGLQPNTPYYYRLRAISKYTVGEIGGGNSAIQVQSTNCNTPADPTGSIVTDPNPSCGSTILGYPAGLSPLVNYWQTTALGVSTSFPTNGSPNYPVSASGTYFVRTLDANTNCWSAGSLATTILIGSAPQASISGPTNHSICQNQVGVSVGLSLNGGSGPYTIYMANNGIPLPAINAIGSSYNVPVPTSLAGLFIYSVDSIMDVNGCKSFPTMVRDTFLVHALPTATISGTTSVCQNAASPSLIFKGTTGSPPFTFYYKRNGITMTPAFTTGLDTTCLLPVSTLDSGIFVYTLDSVADANGCAQAQTGTATVSVYPSPSATVTSSVAAVCQNAASPFVQFSGGLGLAPYVFSYTINNGAQQSVSTQAGANNISVPVSTTNVGTALYHLFAVSDSRGCVSNLSSNASIAVKSLPTALISGGTSICSASGQTIPIKFTGGGNGTLSPYTFTFSVNNGSPQSLTSASGSDTAIYQASITTAGTFVYQIQSVSDANSCSQTISSSTTLYVGQSLMPTINAMDNSGLNYTDGIVCDGDDVVLTANGGLNFLWSTGSTGQSIIIPSDSIQAGGTMYSVEVSINGNCPSTANKTVYKNPLPNASISGPGAICQNEPLAITFTGGGGTAPYSFTYSIAGTGNQLITSSGPGNNNNVSVPVSSGTTGTQTYKMVSVSDSNMCSRGVTDSASIVVRPLPFASISGTTTICQNGVPPVVTLIGSNGVPPYTFYFLRNGILQDSLQTAPTSSMASFTVSTADTGTILYAIDHIVDANGCMQFQSGTVVVRVNPLPLATVSGSTMICQNDPSPMVTFTGSNGTPPYIFGYKLNGGVLQYAATSATDQMATVAASTNNGGQTFILQSVYDANGCGQPQTGSANVALYPLPSASISGTTTVCRNAPSPVVTFTGSAGMPPYTFTYRKNGVLQPTISSSGTSSDTSFTVSTADTGVITYSLEMVSDANGCSQSQTGTAVISIRPLPAAGISGGGQAVCQNAASPMITFSGMGGMPPYVFNYKMNNGPILSVATVSGDTSVSVPVPTLIAGSYTYSLVSVLDALGCSASVSDSAQVTVHSIPTATISGTASACTDPVNTLPVLFTGANGQQPYTFFYSKDNAAPDTIVSASGLNTATIPSSLATSGTFEYKLLSVTDGHGCSGNSSGTVILQVNQTLTAGVSMQDNTGISNTDGIICDGDSVILTATGGVSYTWSNGSSGQSIVVPSDSIFGVNNTRTYTVTVSSVNNNCSVTITREVKKKVLPDATMTAPTSLCQNASDIIALNGTAGTKPFTFNYTLNGGAEQSISTVNSASVDLPISSNATGSLLYHLVKVSDSNGCIRALNTPSTVIVNPLPLASISGTTMVCRNAPSPVVTFVGSAGTPPYTFTYRKNGVLQPTISSSSSGSDTSFTVSTADTGIITYSLEMVSDANGCSQPQTGTAVISIRPLPAASISGGGQVCQNDPAQLITMSGSAGSRPYTFYYRLNGIAQVPVNGSLISDNVVFAVSTALPGIYTYNLDSVSDINGCRQVVTGSATVIVKPLPSAGISGTTTVCRNASSPVVTFTGSAGTPPYTFTYRKNGVLQPTISTGGPGSATSFTVSTADTGIITYSLEMVSDANGCSQSQTGTAVISIRPLPAAGISGGGQVCQNDPAQVITMSGSAGSRPYTFYYRLNGNVQAPVSSSLISDNVGFTVSTALPGIYTYNLDSVSDINGCRQVLTGSATVIVKPRPFASISGSVSVCQNAAPPAVILTGSGGTMPYTFQFNLDGVTDTIQTSSGSSSVSLPVPTSSSGSLSYTLIHVKDSNACERTVADTAIISVSSAPSATLTANDTIRCKNAPPAVLTFRGQNGVAPYQFKYTINGVSQPIVSTTPTTDSVSILVPTSDTGTFVYALDSVIGNNSCSQYQSGSILFRVNPLPTASFSTNNYSICSGGSIDLKITAYSGTPPFTFSYTLNNQVMDSLVSGPLSFEKTVPVDTLVAGGKNYILTEVKDGNGCYATPPLDNIAITVYANPLANISGSDTVCQYEPSFIKFTGNAGNSPYTFHYRRNNANYTLSTISPDSIAYLAVPTDTVGTFHYILDNVEDANGCLSLLNGTATVVVNPAPSASMLISDTAVCQNDGSPVITFTGSLASAPYTFHYTQNGLLQLPVTSNGNSSNITVATASPGGYVYALIAVDDANACHTTLNDAVFLTIHASPNATISGSTAVCQNSPAPFVTLSGSSGIPPYTFTYKKNLILDSITSSSPDTTIQHATTVVGNTIYSLIQVRDATGCSQHTFTAGAAADITVNPLPTASISVTPKEICQFNPSPVVTFTGDNGLSPYTFYYKLDSVSLSPITTSSGMDTANFYVPTSVAGNKIFSIDSVKDANGCLQAQSHSDTIRIHPLPTATISISKNIVCQYDDSIRILFTGVAGVPPYTFYYSKNGKPGSFISSQSSTDTVGFNVSTADTGVITYTLTKVSDSVGCESQNLNKDTSYTVYASPEKPIVKVELFADSVDSFCNGSTNINFYVQNISTGIRYKWTTSGAGIDSIGDDDNPNTMISLFGAGDHVVKVEASTFNSCTSKDSIIFKVVPSENEFTERQIILKQPGNLLVYPDNSMDQSDTIITGNTTTIINGYQWGYNIRHKPDSLGRAEEIQGQVYQVFVPDTIKFIKDKVLDTVNYAFWVMLKNGNCRSRVYYNGPYAHQRMPVIDETDQDAVMSIFPNPTPGNFSLVIHGNVYGELDMRCYNTFGQVVHQRRFEKTKEEAIYTVQLPTLPEGVYTLHLTSKDHQQFFIKVIVQH